MIKGGLRCVMFCVYISASRMPLFCPEIECNAASSRPVPHCAALLSDTHSGDTHVVLPISGSCPSWLKTPLTKSTSAPTLQRRIAMYLCNKANSEGVCHAPPSPLPSPPSLRAAPLRPFPRTRTHSHSHRTAVRLNHSQPLSPFHRPF